MLSVGYGTNKPKEILTDVYLERGIFSGCLRYSVSIEFKTKTQHSLSQGFTDYAIGNGVIISTLFGSNGYYDYPERIRLRKRWSDTRNTRNTRNTERFSDNKIGICHIIPAFLIRKNVDNAETFQSHKIDSIQYTIASKSVIKISSTNSRCTAIWDIIWIKRGSS